MFVHHQQLLHAMPVQDLFRFLKRGAHGTVMRFSLVITSEIGRS